MADVPPPGEEPRAEAPPAAETPPHEPAPPAQPPAAQRQYRSTGVWASVVVFALAAAAFLVFIAQNTEQVSVHWTVWHVEVSLAAVVFGAMLLGSLLTIAVGAIWRYRRRRELRRREELRSLRARR
jgi:uncharacterized integral membrane protein